MDEAIMWIGLISVLLQAIALTQYRGPTTRTKNGKKFILPIPERGHYSKTGWLFQVGALVSLATVFLLAIIHMFL